MRLRLARRALADAKRKKTWWRRNRPDAADLFEHELDAILERIARRPRSDSGSSSAETSGCAGG